MKFALGLIKDWGIALAAMFAIFVVFTTVMTPSPPGDGPAPTFALPNLSGSTVSLDELGADGRTVVLNFWFTSCPPCRKEIPELSAYHREHPDVALVGISVDRMAPERLAAASQRLGVTYPVLHDPDGVVARAYGVSVFPTTVVIRDGQVVSSRVGEVNRASLATLVAER